MPRALLAHLVRLTPSPERWLADLILVAPSSESWQALHALRGKRVLLVQLKHQQGCTRLHVYWAGNTKRRMQEECQNRETKLLLHFKYSFFNGGGSGKSAKNTRIEREWFNLIMSRETYQTQAKRFPEICQFSLASNSSFSKMGTPKSINNERPKTRTQKVSRLWLKAVHLKRHAFGVKQNGCSCEKS